MFFNPALRGMEAKTAPVQPVPLEAPQGRQSATMKAGL
jgi:hypothetical protein